MSTRKLEKRLLTDAYGRRVACEWWLMSRRQCRHLATVELAHPRDGAPYRYCAVHAAVYRAAHPDREVSVN